MLHTLMAVAGRQPFILLFLTVAAGYGLGRLQVKGIGLGATASTLLIALAVSLLAAQVGVQFKVPEFASVLFFNLYMFAVGMKVGPQFISGLRANAARFIAIAVLIPLLSVGLMFGVRALFHLQPGFTAGIFAGSNTATPGLGAAQAAYAGGAAHVPAGTTAAAAQANLSTAFAFTYCLSMVLFIVLIKLSPALMRRDVKRAARELEASIHGAGTAPLPGAGAEFLGDTLPVAVRTYRVEQSRAIGHSLRELRAAYPLVSVERLLRAGQSLEARDEVVIQSGDTLALHGRIERLLDAAPRIGPEVDAPEIRELGAETVEVVVHRPESSGHTLLELARDAGHGLFLNAMFRGGEQIPFGPDTVVDKGDVLRVTGARWRIQLLEQRVGKVVRPSLATDIVTLALGLAAGGFIGAITIPLGRVHLTVSSAVGLLLVGTVLSTLRTRNPAFGGPFPEPARRLLEDLGLNVFIAVLGLNAGAGVLQAIAAGALTPILVGCLLVGFVPAIVAVVLGHRVLRLNDALLLGAVAGGRCNSGGMRAAQEATSSNVPAISYPVTFAISNVIFTLMSYMMAMVG
jgi:putative transport protein